MPKDIFREGQKRGGRPTKKERSEFGKTVAVYGRDHPQRTISFLIRKLGVPAYASDFSAWIYEEPPPPDKIVMLAMIITFRHGDFSRDTLFEFEQKAGEEILKQRKTQRDNFIESAEFKKAMRTMRKLEAGYWRLQKLHGNDITFPEFLKDVVLLWRYYEDRGETLTLDKVLERYRLELGDQKLHAEA